MRAHGGIQGPGRFRAWRRSTHGGLFFQRHDRPGAQPALPQRSIAGSLWQASLTPGFEENVLDGPGTGGKWRWAILTPPPHRPRIPPWSTCWRLSASGPARRTGPFLARTNEEGAWTLDLERHHCRAAPRRQIGTPLLLLGPAFMFVHLLDYLAGHELHFELAPRLARDGNRRLQRPLARIAARPNCTRSSRGASAFPPPHIICEYGMSELSSQAYDRSIGASGVDSGAADRSSAFPPGRARRSSLRRPAEKWPRAKRVWCASLIWPMSIRCSRFRPKTSAFAAAMVSSCWGGPSLAEPRGCSLMAI